MDKKYYWYSQAIKWDYSTDWGYEDHVSELHPFQERAGLLERLDDLMECVLLNWREITEEDYNLFKKMENE